MSRRRRLIWIILVLVIALAGCDLLDESEVTVTQLPVPTDYVPPASIVPATGETAAVTRIIDGDTIDVRMNGQTYRVRYIGVNTPELDQPCYTDATNANARLVSGQTVTLVKDVSNTDSYGRLLRYVYVGNVFVNAELVKGGWAEARRYPPDTAQFTYLQSLEDAARSANLGCHPTGVFN